jgi:hypothetical protein
MDERELFGDKPWLEHYDIKPEGENVTIEHVEKTPAGKNLLHFFELPKPLTLFWHVYRDIKRILGESDTKNWENKRLKLVPTIVKINGGDEKETIGIEIADPIEEKPEPKKLPTLRRKRDLNDEASERLVAAAQENPFER